MRIFYAACLVLNVFYFNIGFATEDSKRSWGEASIRLPNPPKEINFTRAPISSPDLMVFYTFDAPVDPENRNIKMLSLSIYTVLRELASLDHKVEVRVYTTDPLRLKPHVPRHPQVSIHPLPSLVAETVSQAKTDPSLESSPYRGVNGLLGTPHARVFLLHRLLKERQCPVLYLDNDTGIVEGSGEQLLAGLKEVTTVMTDTLYHRNLYKNVMEEAPFLQDSHLPSWLKRDIKRFCAGILYLQYNEQAFMLAELIEEYYVQLSNELGFMESNDEYALALALDSLAIEPSYPHAYYQADGEKLRAGYALYLAETLQNPLSNIVHYGSQKLDTSGHFDAMLKEWTSYLKQPEGNDLKPYFAMPASYPDLDLLVWGRFELL